MNRTWLVLFAMALVAAACSGTNEETTVDVSSTAPSTAWKTGQAQDLVDLCIRDAANRSSSRPRIPTYSADEAQERCAEDVQILEAQGCSVTKASLVLTDWDQDKSPLQCPSGP